jgi:Ni/Co efflux regulator RcnB
MADKRFTAEIAEIAENKTERTRQREQDRENKTERTRQREQDRENKTENNGNRLRFFLSLGFLLCVLCGEIRSEDPRWRRS